MVPWEDLHNKNTYILAFTSAKASPQPETPDSCKGASFASQAWTMHICFFFLEQCKSPNLGKNLKAEKMVDGSEKDRDGKWLHRPWDVTIMLLLGRAQRWCCTQQREQNKTELCNSIHWIGVFLLFNSAHARTPE